MMDTEALVFDEPTCGQDMAGGSGGCHHSQAEGPGQAEHHNLARYEVRSQKLLPRGSYARGCPVGEGNREEVFCRRDNLYKAFVAPPPITRVTQKAGISPVVFTVSTLAEAIWQATEKGQEYG